jgi:hypothetical protein
MPLPVQVKKRSVYDTRTINSACTPIHSGFLRTKLHPTEPSDP